MLRLTLEVLGDSKRAISKQQPHKAQADEGA